MYQYGISWFSKCLTSATDCTDKVDDIQQRIIDLKKYFTYYIYTKLCCGLRQKVFAALVKKIHRLPKVKCNTADCSAIFTKN